MAFRDDRPRARTPRRDVDVSRRARHRRLPRAAPLSGQVGVGDRRACTSGPLADEVEAAEEAALRELRAISARIRELEGTVQRIRREQR